MSAYQKILAAIALLWASSFATAQPQLILIGENQQLPFDSLGPLTMNELLSLKKQEFAFKPPLSAPLKIYGANPS